LAIKIQIKTKKSVGVNANGFLKTIDGSRRSRVTEQRTKRGWRLHAWHCTPCDHPEPRVCWPKDTSRWNL